MVATGRGVRRESACRIAAVASQSWHSATQVRVNGQDIPIGHVLSRRCASLTIIEASSCLRRRFGSLSAVAYGSSVAR